MSNEFTDCSTGQVFRSGDEVTVDGYSGTWFILEFARNPRDTNGEWCAVLVNGQDHLFWPAHQITKV